MLQIQEQGKSKTGEWKGTRKDKLEKIDAAWHIKKRGNRRKHNNREARLHVYSLRVFRFSLFFLIVPRTVLSGTVKLGFSVLLFSFFLFSMMILTIIIAIAIVKIHSFRVPLLARSNYFFIFYLILQIFYTCSPFSCSVYTFVPSTRYYDMSFC